MAKVWNKNRGDAPEGAVYIGRGSRHGNLFIVGHTARSLAESLHLHKMDLARRPEYLDSLDDLRDKDLLCFCVPRACHGDILLWLAARSRKERREWASRFLSENE